ncbi:transcriptional regulator, TetR family [Paenibacillus sp. UNCCL117]|uniref:TetR/AcrR family transcriptional regulator n=1 Tax=unclassified Paenibacillus TaxID=185978 RepID=UPI00087F5C24|nr:MULTISPECIES: TetR/AcrR family transcriptional regulator [unclassified Paenibacillus]SDD92596.1 DNA-binding transcriptional regulator, AcrR family [Paenibacillus sp. cl123]SFW43430.1 transcriptional regulator, TetR family [Paenibacillus sp. UNCCL117]
MARKAVEHELSRERILGGARELFVEHGYHALTMRSIAKAMGYSHGALYYHFSEKAELFYALVTEDFRDLLNRQREMLRRTRLGDMAQLEKLMLEFIKFGLENPNHYEIMFMIKDPELQRYSRTEQAQCLDLFATVVRSVVAKQENNDSKMYNLPWSLFMSMHGFISYNIHYSQSFKDVKKLAEQHVKYLCEGLQG